MRFTYLTEGVSADCPELCLLLLLFFFECYAPEHQKWEIEVILRLSTWIDRLVYLN